MNVDPVHQRGREVKLTHPLRSEQGERGGLSPSPLCLMLRGLAEQSGLALVLESEALAVDADDDRVVKEESAEVEIGIG